MGFKKAGSKASLIAGTISGAALLASAYLVTSGSATLGLAVGGCASLLLAARFAPGYLQTKKLMPQGVMAVLSVAGVLTSILALSLR